MDIRERPGFNSMYGIGYLNAPFETGTLSTQKFSFMKKLSGFLLLCLVCLSGPAFTQATDSTTVVVIKIKGNIYDKETGMQLSNSMVVNKRTQQGFFTGTSFFEVKIFSTDTLLIGSQGYTTMHLCFRDSLKKELFEVSLYLNKLSYQAKEVEVFGARDLDKIQQDIEKLGYSKKDYVLSTIDALNSPITFLYQQFSRKERAKRDLAELKNNDLKRALLKELFVKYVSADIIDLEHEEFDAFIDYCNVSDEFMINSTQYEFIMFIKKKYEIYKMVRMQK